ncbi:MAG: hypothetical protein IBX55_17870 [Methyloprofundus sp.]|nr:hypothetical protein [Methyloprofundus sp.]
MEYFNEVLNSSNADVIIRITGLSLAISTALSISGFLIKQAMHDLIDGQSKTNESVKGLALIGFWIALVVALFSIV